MRKLELTITETTTQAWEVMVPDDFDTADHEALAALAGDMVAGSDKTAVITDLYDWQLDSVQVDVDVHVEPVDA